MEVPIQSLIRTWRHQSLDWNVFSFANRAAVLDHIELNALDRLEALNSIDENSNEMNFRSDIEDFKLQLENMDAQLISMVRQGIIHQKYLGENFKKLLHQCIPPMDQGKLGLREQGYDVVDSFVNGILHPEPFPEDSRTLEVGMVFFQKTPARIVLELVERYSWSSKDRFMDLGSGFGQVPFLLHLCTGLPVVGIEIQASYCEYARKLAETLNLSEVEIVECDARQADFSQATVFFLYSSFEQAMLIEILDRWCKNSLPSARLFAYGPCNEVLFGYSGLSGRRPPGDIIHTLCEFSKSNFSNSL